MVGERVRLAQVGQQRRQQPLEVRCPPLAERLGQRGEQLRDRLPDRLVVVLLLVHAAALGEVLRRLLARVALLEQGEGACGRGREREHGRAQPGGSGRQSRQGRAGRGRAGQAAAPLTSGSVDAGCHGAFARTEGPSSSTISEMDSAAAATVSLSSSSLKVETRVRQLRWSSQRVALPSLDDAGASPLTHG